MGKRSNKQSPDTHMGQSMRGISTSPTPPNSTSAEQQIKAQPKVDVFADIQAELFSKLSHANLRWMGTIEKRAHLASDFSAELAAAQSFAEAVSACQRWVRRRMEIAEEDAKQLCSDSEAFMTTAARLFLGSEGKAKKIAGT